MKKNKSKLKKLLTIFGWSTGISLLIGVSIISIFIYSYNKFIYKDRTTEVIPSSVIQNGSDENKDTETVKDLDKNLAVFGVDKDGLLTDVIFVANFDSTENAIDIISLPRDTKVTWDKNLQNRLYDIRDTAPGNLSNTWVSKLNQVASKGGTYNRTIEDNIADLTIYQIEKMLDIKIDNYVVINLDIFRKIVDIIGGVEVDVPQRMYYVDNYQGLYIDLQPGLQVLDGEHAEMFVRYRKGYAEGDVGRIKAQQLFLEAFAKKVLSPKIIFKAPQLISLLFSDLTTDIKIEELGTYLPYAQKFNMENLNFFIIPGEGRMENGQSYFFPDMDELDKMKQSIFTKHKVSDTSPSDEAPTTTPNTIEKDTSVSVHILNGNGVTGIANKLKLQLETSGYTVNQTGNYERFDVETTKIVAKDKAKAAQFERYFEETIIEEDSSISSDIQIILGKNYNN